MALVIISFCICEQKLEFCSDTQNLYHVTDVFVLAKQKMLACIHRTWVIDFFDSVELVLLSVSTYEQEHMHTHDLWSLSLITLWCLSSSVCVYIRTRAHAYTALTVIKPVDFLAHLLLLALKSLVLVLRAKRQKIKA
jgi:hypothetical protein